MSWIIIIDESQASKAGRKHESRSHAICVDKRQGDFQSFGLKQTRFIVHYQYRWVYPAKEQVMLILLII